MSDFLEIFRTRKPLIGVVHLPRLKIGIEQKIINRAIRDASLYIDSGLDGIVVENYGDRPFTKFNIDEWKKKILIKLMKEVRSIIDEPLGLNILRNDALSAIDIAIGSEADFIRVNFLIGVAVTPEGLIEGIANLLYKKKAIYDDVKYIYIVADIHTKHSIKIYPYNYLIDAQETVERGLADALVITGILTGKPPKLSHIFRIKSFIDKPIFVGSGVTPDNLYMYLLLADGAIVGTYLHENSDLNKPISKDRINRIVCTLNSLRKLL